MSEYLVHWYHAMFACGPDLYAAARISNSRWLHAPATTETDTPEPFRPGVFCFLATHSRIVPRSPCSGGDLATLGAGRERDVVDQGTDSIGRLIPLCGCWSASARRSTFHLPAIDAGDIGVNVRDVDRRGSRSQKLVLLRLQFAQPRHERTAVDPNPCVRVAVVVRCRKRCVVGRAIFVLDNRRPRPEKFQSRDRLGLETASGQCKYSIHINSL